MKVSQNAKLGHSFFQLKIKRKQRFQVWRQFQHVEYDMNQTYYQNLTCPINEIPRTLEYTAADFQPQSWAWFFSWRILLLSEIEVIDGSIYLVYLFLFGFLKPYHLIIPNPSLITGKSGKYKTISQKCNQWSMALG